MSDELEPGSIFNDSLPIVSAGGGASSYPAGGAPVETIPNTNRGGRFRPQRAEFLRMLAETVDPKTGKSLWESAPEKARELIDGGDGQMLRWLVDQWIGTAKTTIEHHVDQPELVMSFVHAMQRANLSNALIESIVLDAKAEALGEDGVG